VTFADFGARDKGTNAVSRIDSTVQIGATFVPGPPLQLTVTLAGDYTLVNGDGTSALRDALASATYVGNDGTYEAVSFAARLLSAALGGAVVISTDVPFADQGGTLPWPETGTLRVSKADGPGFVELNADTGDETTVQVTVGDAGGSTSEIIDWEAL
jgi:hypothetical protein